MPTFNLLVMVGPRQPGAQVHARVNAHAGPWVCFRSVHQVTSKRQTGTIAARNSCHSRPAARCSLRWPQRCSSSTTLHASVSGPGLGGLGARRRLWRKGPGDVGRSSAAAMRNAPSGVRAGPLERPSRARACRQSPAGADPLCSSQSRPSSVHGDIKLDNVRLPSIGL